MASTNKAAEQEASTFKSYPASIQEVSAMLVHAQRESFSTPEGMDKESRAEPFKKSHTCGSLYAKCACNNDSVSLPSKRASNPHLSSSYKPENKRHSNPEISTLLIKNYCHRDSGTVIKANVFLSHPEITFPIHVEFPKDLHRITIDHSEIKKSHLDYHKYTALAYESCANKDEKAKKFLEDFGILEPSMGNGVSFLHNQRNSKSSIDEEIIRQIRKNSQVNEAKRRHSGVPEDYEYRTMMSRLRKELSELELKYGSLQEEYVDTKHLLHEKDGEIVRLQREVHKLKSVLQQTTTFNQDILASLQEKHAMANRTQTQQSQNTGTVLKKQGVSAESSESSGQVTTATITKHDKNSSSKQLIKEALMDNDFLKKLDTYQMKEIVDCMYLKELPAESYVIREGEAGAHLYVSAEGKFEVIKDNVVLGEMGPGKAFGELAILYNCTRTASIKVIEDSKVWVLDRKVFQQIMMRTGIQRLNDNIGFLKSVPLLRDLSEDVIMKIADVLEVEFYPEGAHIIRQGANGDTFFIISSGSVKVTQRISGCLEEKYIRTLERGQYFGEQALIKEECRTASIIAMPPGVECLTLDRDSFKNLIGNLSEFRTKDYGDEHRISRLSDLTIEEQQEYDYIKLEELDIVATLGIGGFGRVELVQYTSNPSLTFALKCLKKQHIVDTQQQDHVFSERNIMMSCRTPFICRLYRTFKDSKYVYMLLEACLGGEIWTILRDRGFFDEYTTKFITACVLEAFDYLHSRGIIYRDLKPENLLLDSQGYVKLTDFGFSKKLGYTNKTWTFCGTPEYVAPETILNKGHDKAVDYWALGILMHELLTGNPPFTAPDPMKTYNQILKGIDMIDFVKHSIGRTAQSLIKKLCRHSPSERLGCQWGGIQDIRKHKWFEGFDWGGLVARTLPSPLKQAIKGPCDTSNFDCFSRDSDIPSDEHSNWDRDF